MHESCRDFVSSTCTYLVPADTPGLRYLSDKRKMSGGFKSASFCRTIFCYCVYSLSTTSALLVQTKDIGPAAPRHFSDTTHDNQVFSTTSSAVSRSLASPSSALISISIYSQTLSKSPSLPPPNPPAGFGAACTAPNAFPCGCAGAGADVIAVLLSQPPKSSSAVT